MSGTSSNKYNGNRMSTVHPADGQGWECPKCKRVHAPSMKSCPFCSRINEDTTDTMEFLNE